MMEPNWGSPPGETIARLMARLEIHGPELADALGLSADDFELLLVGQRRLTKDDAVILADTLGSTARFWLSRDKSYVVDMARLDPEGPTDQEATWLASMPTPSMRKFGWVPKQVRAKDRLMQEILSFFECTTLQEWGQRYSSGVGAVAFRTSLSLPSDGMATLVWLRAGELSIANQNMPRFDRRAFEKLLPALKKLSAFKRPSLFLPRLIDACRAVGVYVTTVRTPDGCRASGASWFDAKGNPIILLSFRHLAEDHFWFTFFHEAAHVTLHGRNHIDGEGADVMNTDGEKQEREANEFAQELLFPEEMRETLQRRIINAKSIMLSARAAGVTAGIVVGQLEKACAIQHGRFSYLKHRYRWGEDPYIPELVS